MNVRIVAIFAGGMIAGAVLMRSMPAHHAGPAMAPPAVEPAAPVAAGDDARDQYAFAAELYRAERLPSDDAPVELERIRSNWLNRRYQWEVLRITPLCQRAGPCLVAPFEQTRAGKRIVEGWLPRLNLGGEGFSALEAACRGLEACVLRFEGTLSELSLSLDAATSLAFSDVRILGARALLPTESFVRAK